MNYVGKGKSNVTNNNLARIVPKEILLALISDLVSQSNVYFAPSMHVDYLK